jgi:hypothetical protein
MDTPDDAPALRLIERWVAFWNSYDLDQFDALFVSADTVTYFSSERGGLITGQAELRQHHAGFGFVSGGKPSANRLWLTDIALCQISGAQTLLAIWHFQRAGAPAEQHGPVTFVLAPEQGEVRIAHAHFANAR